MSGTYSNNRPAGREHIPVYPKGFIAIRIVQLVVAVTILGLDAYVLSEILTTGAELNIFTAIATMIIAIYCIVVEFSVAGWKGYNYWAILALDIFALIFWLISFALMAAQVAPFADGFTFCGVYVCTTYALEGVFLTIFACMATVAGLGGVEFILFIVSLAIHSVAMHRHRTAGGRSASGSSAANDNAIALAGGPVHANAQAEKQQPAPSYATVPQHQQQHQQQSYQQQQYTTPTPPPQGQVPYQPPSVASPQPQQPYQGQQQQQVSPMGTGQQHGGAFGAPAPHPGSYEAQGQSVGHPQY